MSHAKQNPCVPLELQTAQGSPCVLSYSELPLPPTSSHPDVGSKLE